MQAIFDQGQEQAGAFFSQVPQAGAQAQGMSEGFLGQAQEFDPFAAAETQFSRLDEILARSSGQERTGTQGALLASGRLGSSAGARVQGSLEQGIQDQRAQMLDRSFMQAQQVQDSLINRGTTLGAFGQQQQAGLQALGTGALNTSLGLDAQQQGQLALGSNITKHEGQAAQQSGLQSIIQGGLTAGAAKLGGMV